MRRSKGLPSSHRCSVLFLLALGLGVSMVSQAVPINVDVSTLTGTSTLSEVSIDINPSNPKNRVIISHGGDLKSMATFYTLDNGQSWAQVALGNTLDKQPATATRFDPTITFDRAGNLYVAYGVNDGTNTSIWVAKSTDGGKTFAAHLVDTQANIGSVVGNDKWQLTTGPNKQDPTKDNVYIAWNRLLPTGTAGSYKTPVMLAASQDGGTTWGTKTQVSAPSSDLKANWFAEPAVNKDGTVYVSWHSRTDKAVWIATSTDAGASFGASQKVADINSKFVNSAPGSAVGAFVKIRAQPDRGVFVGPTLDTDRSTGKFKNRIYEAYVDLTGDYVFGSKENTDILVKYSDDNGKTWSTGVKVNDDTGSNSQFLPWLDVDPTTGVVGALWYDARNDINNTLVDVYGAFSYDGGATFSKNFLYSSSASAPSQYGGNYLEYIGLAGYKGQFCGAWSKSIAGSSNLDIITSCVPEPSSIALFVIGMMVLLQSQFRRRNLSM